MTNCEA